jgi:hypothetical protein
MTLSSPEEFAGAILPDTPLEHLSLQQPLHFVGNSVHSGLHREWLSIT